MKTLPVPKFMVRIRVTDKAGKIIKELYEPGHSWTRNGYGLWMVAMSGCGGIGDTSFGAGYLSSKTTSGTIYSTAYAIRIQEFASGANHLVDNDGDASGAGICVGAGNTAFNVNDFQLASKIGHGTGIGQLSYGIQTAVASVYNAQTKTWTMTNSRQFHNGSGASITIAEIGLYSEIGIFYFSYTQYLVARDVLASTITVADGENVDVAYETIFDLSAID